MSLPRVAAGLTACIAGPLAMVIACGAQRSSNGPARVRDATAGCCDDGGDGSPTGIDASEAAFEAGVTLPDPSVLQFHNHANRDGFFIDSRISTSSAATFHLDPTFTAHFAGNVFASPLYVRDGVRGRGTFFVVTEENDIFAFDESTGATVWHQNVGTPAASSGTSCGNISPIGITGTPAIDLGTRRVVFDAAKAGPTGYLGEHTIYALSIDTGFVEWQLNASTLLDASGLAFNTVYQNQRGAVLILGGIAYVAYGGHGGDCGDYHGWVVGVPLSGASARAWATRVQGAGIWGPGGPASDGESIFVTTGNGFDASTTWAESEGLLRLAPGPSFTGQSEDFFAPYNWYLLDTGDQDLSGSGPLVIDTPNVTPSALVMAQGKDGNLYLLDRTNLGGIATQSTTANVGTLHAVDGNISNAGAWANVDGHTYVVVRPNGTGSGHDCPGGSTGDLVAVRLSGDLPQKMSVAWCADAGGQGSPIITSSNGVNNGLVWSAGAESSNALHAWDVSSGAVVLDGSNASIPLSGSATLRHFTTPLAANGRIVVAADDGLYAFGP